MSPRTPRRADVVVIGGGQSGLSAAHHLARRGFRSALTDGTGEAGATGGAGGAGASSYVVLDAAPAPGGAWQHRWESLTMSTVNGIFDLPGASLPAVDPAEPSRVALPRWFAGYEAEQHLAVLRPVRVDAVRRVDDDPDGDLLVETDGGTSVTRAVVNASGTWTNPVLPRYPGLDTFAGRQLHTRDYTSAAELAGLRVAVVGGGISAVQLLSEISRVASTTWYTRREPVFRDTGFRPEVEGRRVVAAVAADVEAGRPTGSVVSYTGLVWTPYAIEARERGVLERRPMFTRVEPDGVVEADGSHRPLDVIVWATGFRAALGHLDPLGLRTGAGGIALRGTEVVGEPRVHLVGFGPSQSTVGSNRSGRAAVAALVERLRLLEPTG